MESYVEVSMLHNTATILLSFNGILCLCTAAADTKNAGLCAGSQHTGLPAVLSRLVGAPRA